MTPTPPAAGADCALFLDFDGTLVELAPRPDAVSVPPALPPLLAALVDHFGGAVAVLSGRPLDQIDAWLRPLTLPAAGVHGSERRGADGTVTRLAVPGLDARAAELERWAASRPGLLVERKPAAIALHYRGADAMEHDCLQAMNELSGKLPGMTLMRGKKVLELKPRQADKGAALRVFLGEAPFRGRRPVFLGDDVTDEAGFEAVLALGGLAIKVGAGETLAPFRLADPPAVWRWLGELLPASR